MISSNHVTLKESLDSQTNRFSSSESVQRMKAWTDVLFRLHLRMSQTASVPSVEHTFHQKTNESLNLPLKLHTDTHTFVSSSTQRPEDHWHSAAAHQQSADQGESRHHLTAELSPHVNESPESLEWAAAKTQRIHREPESRLVLATSSTETHSDTLLGVRGTKKKTKNDSDMFNDSCDSNYSNDSIKSTGSSDLNNSGDSN